MRVGRWLIFRPAPDRDTSGTPDMSTKAIGFRDTGRVLGWEGMTRCFTATGDVTGALLAMNTSANMAGIMAAACSLRGIAWASKKLSGARNFFGMPGFNRMKAIAGAG